MNNSERKKAERKADLALIKLQDIYYLNGTDRIVRRLNDALDKVRELLNEIETTNTQK